MAACNLTQGRQEVCKESIGGLQGVYFLNFNTGSFTTTTDPTTGMVTVTALPSGSTVYYYELKGTSAYQETVNSSRANGTTFFNQQITLNLKKITNEMSTQLKLMAYGRPKVIVWTNNGDAFVAGIKLGCDVTAGSISTGAALGDLYGYSITLTGMEQLPAPFLSGSTTSNPFAGLSSQPTIVYS
mgnify:FL=1